MASLDITSQRDGSCPPSQLIPGALFMGFRVSISYFVCLHPVAVLHTTGGIPTLPFNGGGESKWSRLLELNQPGSVSAHTGVKLLAVDSLQSTLFRLSRTNPKPSVRGDNLSHETRWNNRIRLPSWWSEPYAVACRLFLLPAERGAP